jgi:DNA-directed RNA polymerase subunit RPC12/RpoP
MNQLLKQSVGQIKCEIVGHEASKDNEKKLFDIHNNDLYTSCTRCGANIILKKHPEKSDEYFVTEY